MIQKKQNVPLVHRVHLAGGFGANITTKNSRKPTKTQIFVNYLTCDLVYEGSFQCPWGEVPWGGCGAGSGGVRATLGNVVGIHPPVGPLELGVPGLGGRP